MWQNQQGTANAGHPWNLWKSSQKQGWREVALASLPRPPCFLLAHRQCRSVKAPSLRDSGNPCAHSLAVVWALGSLPTAELLWVSQPYLRQREDSGEGETAAVQVQISAGFPLLPKFLFVDGWMLVLLDWQVQLARTRGNEGGGRQREAHLLSYELWLLLPGRPAFGRLSWAPLCQGQGHTPGSPRSSPTTAGSGCKAALAQGKSHPLCPVVQFQELQLVPPKRSGVIYPSEGIWSWFEDLRSWKITVALSSLFEWWFLSLLSMYHILRGIWLSLPGFVFC